jgi:uncharacterized protein (TIGR02145 family)
MTKKIIFQAIAAMLVLLPCWLPAQVVIGGSTPDPSAILEVRSDNRGILLSRMTTAQRDAIVSPAAGLMIFNTTTLCMEINLGTPASPSWERVSCRNGIISTLDCAGASVSGPSVSIPYTGGNGGVYSVSSIASTGIIGLEATLPAGNFATGAGSLTWTVTGSPSSAGSADFLLEAGGLTCSIPFTVVAGTIAALNCSSTVMNGTLVHGVPAAGVSLSIPYTGGNGGFYTHQTISSTGVTGLTATLADGIYTVGAGNLTCQITGTPSGAGTASFTLNTGGQMCTLSVSVAAGSVGSLNCAGASLTGTLYSGQAASGVSASVPYTGGNEGVHTGQTVTSTGVTGLTATLSAGSFANGAGNLTHNITGTPASAGMASFALNIGGQTCNMDVTVTSAPICSAKVSTTETKIFMCYNLGAANTSADPFTPSWEINGGYWQWGRLAQAAPGPTGPGAGQANEGVIIGWNNGAANESWVDGSKTGNDPCPAGYRVPTKAQWDGVCANNTQTNVGTFSNSITNYSAGKKFGDNLMFPAAGDRPAGNGALYHRGEEGYYWSSTELNTDNAWFLYLFSSGANTDGHYNYSRSNGLTVRCIAE